MNGHEACEESYRWHLALYCRHADGFVIVYDITNKCVAALPGGIVTRSLLVYFISVRRCRRSFDTAKILFDNHYYKRLATCENANMIQV